MTCDVNTTASGRRRAWARCCWRRRQGKRYALPNANVMIHQVLGGAEAGQRREIRVKHMLKLKQTLNAILSKHTGKRGTGGEDCDRDNFMSAEEAKAYGLVITSCNRARNSGVEKTS